MTAADADIFGRLKVRKPLGMSGNRTGVVNGLKSVVWFLDEYGQKTAPTVEWAVIAPGFPRTGFSELGGSGSVVAYGDKAAGMIFGGSQKFS